MSSGNLLEAQVKQVVRELLASREDLCNCQQCQRDMFALAMSNLQPRYAGSEEGRIVLDSIDISSTQTRMDVFRVVLQAAEKVNERPHHNR